MNLYGNFLDFVKKNKNTVFRYCIKGVNDDEKAFYGKISECIHLGNGEYLIGIKSQENHDGIFFYKLSDIEFAIYKKDNILIV